MLGPCIRVHQVAYRVTNIRHSLFSTGPVLWVLGDRRSSEIYGSIVECLIGQRSTCTPGVWCETDRHCMDIACQCDRVPTPHRREKVNRQITELRCDSLNLAFSLVSGRTLTHAYLLCRAFEVLYFKLWMILRHRHTEKLILVKLVYFSCQGKSHQSERSTFFGLNKVETEVVLVRTCLLK